MIKWKKDKLKVFAKGRGIFVTLTGTKGDIVRNDYIVAIFIYKKSFPKALR